MKWYIGSYYVFNGSNINPQPLLLDTDQLILRPFAESDEFTLQRLLDDRELADNMINIPHPYTLEDARHFVRWTRNPILNDGVIALAIVPKAIDALKAGDTLAGGVYLRPEPDHQRAEIGYWCGRDYRGRGYTTAAAARIVQHGFVSMGFNRIYAYCFTTNAASAAVLRKCGMQYEGTHRADVRKPDGWRDVAFYGVLKSEWRASRS